MTQKPGAARWVCLSLRVPFLVLANKSVGARRACHDCLLAFWFRAFFLIPIDVLECRLCVDGMCLFGDWRCFQMRLRYR